MRKVYVDTGRTTEKKEYESFAVESSFVQMYIDIGEVMFMLRSSVELQLLLWTTTMMDNYNQINLNKANRSEFISSSKSNNGKPYSDSTVKRAIRDLQNANAIVSMSDDARREAKYMINPNYFWRTKNQKDRIDAIRGYRYQLKSKKNEAN